MAITRYVRYGSQECPNEVWKKASPIEGKNPDIWRYDVAGVKIRFDDLKSATSRYAWNIDHIIPKTRGGSDELINLQPLNRRDNISCGNGCSRDKPGYDKRAHFECILESLMVSIKKRQTIKLQEGEVINVRQSPCPNAFWRRAIILSASKQHDKVIVRWVDGKKYNEDLVYDNRLFDKL